MLKFRRVALLTATTLLTAASMVAAQEQAQDADELARQLANPARANWAMGLNMDYTLFGGDLPGAGDQSSFGMVFQPQMPTILGDSGYNLLFRPAIPFFFNQPIYNGTDYDSSGFQLGDIGFDLALGTTTESGILWLAGLVGSVPTGTDDRLKGQWAFGPEFAAGVVKPWGVVGALFSQKWDVAGDGDTNVLGGQYFYAFALSNGWQFGAAPTFSYDWTTEQFAFPLGAGLTKATFAGTLPLRLQGQVWYWVARPDAFGSDWTLRFTVTPVIKALW